MSRPRGWLRWRRETPGNGRHYVDIAVTDAGPQIRTPRPEPRVPWVNIALFGATVFTTMLVGSGYTGEPVDVLDLATLARGIPFSFTLLAILLVHELGHFVLSRVHRVRASWPYFIPFPNIIGTLGAVIRIKSPMPHRTALLDIGAAGPIAGFLVAVPAIVFGLQVSEVRAPGATEAGIQLGESLLMMLAERVVFGDLPDTYIVTLGPVAFAGWVGLLVTALNLMPIGQLDGGHIIYALFGRRQGQVAKVFFVALLIMTFWWIGWIMWAVMGLVFRLSHPPTVNDFAPLGPGRRAIGWICLAIFILCFAPVPISMP